MASIAEQAAQMAAKRAKAQASPEVASFASKDSETIAFPEHLHVPVHTVMPQSAVCAMRDYVTLLFIFPQTASIQRWSQEEPTQ